MKTIILVNQVSTPTNGVGYVIHFDNGQSVYVSETGLALALRNSGLSYSAQEALQLLAGCTCATPIHQHAANETVVMSDESEVTFKNAGYHLDNGTVLQFSLPASTLEAMRIAASNRAAQGVKTSMEIALEALLAKKRNVAVVSTEDTKAPTKNRTIPKTIANAVAE